LLGFRFDMQAHLGRDRLAIGHHLLGEMRALIGAGRLPLAAERRRAE
jgi:hypothetical protein